MPLAAVMHPCESFRRFVALVVSSPVFVREGFGRFAEVYRAKTEVKASNYPYHVLYACVPLVAMLHTSFGPGPKTPQD